jgi:pteridine reductase
MANKVALITGAAVRIGAATSELLHQAGFHVVLHYRHSESKAQALAARLNALRADSASIQQADLADVMHAPNLIQRVLDDRQRLDVLINNASMYYPTPLGSVSQTDWDDLFASNVRAPFFLAQVAAPALRASQGCIVNLVDIYAERPIADHPVYCMAKAANAMMVKSLAQDLAPDIRVNGVSPGVALWPVGDDNTAEQQATLERVPLGRPSGAEEIAAAVRFMVVDSSYVTGQILAVDGGRSVQQ